MHVEDRPSRATKPSSSLASPHARSSTHPRRAAGTYLSDLPGPGQRGASVLRQLLRSTDHMTSTRVKSRQPPQRSSSMPQIRSALL